MNLQAAVDEATPIVVQGEIGEAVGVEVEVATQKMLGEAMGFVLVTFLWEMTTRATRDATWVSTKTATDEATEWP